MSSDAPEINPDDLEPTIDIDLKLQKRILQLHAILKTADHYTLLGVSPLADKKDIRTAYFDLMNLYHADKYYGKKLGSFAPKLQQIVQTLTKASDTLSRKKTRAEYDAYLASRQSTLGARTSVVPRAQSSRPPYPGGSIPSARPAVAPIDFIPQIPRAPRAPALHDGDRLTPSSMSAPNNPAPSASASLRSAPPRSAPNTGGPSSSNPNSSDPNSSDPSGSGPNSVGAPPRSGAVSQDAARRMLARKMGHRGTVVPGAVRAERPSPPPTASARQAIEADLRQRFDARRNPGKKHLEKYLAMAEDAHQKGDWPGAVSAMKLAAQAAPDDPGVLARQAAIQQEADRALAPRFLEQARYEEKDGHPERAARSYERAAQGQNSAELFEKAARCLLRLSRLSDTDKRKVVEMARKSVALDNRSADYRLTLARAYDASGMRTSAQGEVRRALELEPNNKDAKELQKALK